MIQRKPLSVKQYFPEIERGDTLNVMSPAGIGDFLWLMSKWYHIAQQRNVVFWLPEGEQQRTGALASMLGVKYGYLPGLKTDWVWSQKGDPQIPKKGCWLTVHPNRHLEEGKPLADWYPEIPLVYPKPQINYVPLDLPPHVLGFTCVKNYMGGQLPAKLWGEMFSYIENYIAPVRLVGAGRDVEFCQEVEKYYRSPIPPLYNRPLEEVLAATQQAGLMVGVASGLLITGLVLGCPVYFAYPQHLSKMPGTWEPKKSIYDWCFVRDLPEMVFSGQLEELIEVNNGYSGSGLSHLRKY